MNEPQEPHELTMLLVASAIVLAVLARSLFARFALPALIGYLLIGFSIRVADEFWSFLSPPVWATFSFLADAGLVTLLFHVGLESNLKGLISKLPRASIIWIGDVIASSLVAFAAAYYLFNIQLIPALVLTAGITATSVGVAIRIWEEAGAVNSKNGQLLLDVAELDDISGVALMALLLSLMPVLRGDAGESAFFEVLGWSIGVFAVKLIAFTVFCYLFGRYFESHIMRWVAQLKPPAERMLLVAGVGFLIATLAGWMGFSLAIGALFAGLVFSRDPMAVKTEPAFQNVYAFFTPFFFIGIGLQVAPSALDEALWFSAAFFIAACLGKLIGVGIPAFFSAGLGGAALIGVSMIPRAEITLVVADYGRRLGSWAMPDAIYAAIVVASAATCLVSPLALRPMFRRWPQRTEPE